MQIKKDIGKEIIKTLEIKDIDKEIIKTLEMRGRTHSKDLEDLVIEGTGIASSTYYHKLKQLWKTDMIKRDPPDWENKINVVYYLEGQEKIQDETRKLQLDFKPNIKAWLDQLYIWDDFFTPWVHSKKSLFGFDGVLRVEYEPTYPHFREYVKNLIEDKPELCPNPFSEQNKLKEMMKKFNDKRDPIIEEIESAIRKQNPNIKQKTKESLMEIVLIRISKELIPDDEFTHLQCWISMHNPPSDINEEIIRDVLAIVLSSKSVTKKSVTALWSMISESEQILNNIIRSLKVLQQIKE